MPARIRQVDLDELLAKGARIGLTAPAPRPRPAGPAEAAGAAALAARVLGLDPGSVRTGWGVVEVMAGGRLRLVAGGTIASGGRQPMPERLLKIHRELGEIIARHRPGEVAVEGVFASLNPRTAIVLGQARGAALLAGALAGLPVYEYPPASVKKALVGTGRAEKRQVRVMVEALLNESLPPPSEFSLDASDALAIAMCHLQSRALRARGLR
ncbi:MAG: crossover junction endodeoxyribonuclease RuvC [Thermodesulfobacteriota bacterium]